MSAKPCAQLRSVEGIQYELVRKKVKQLHLRVRSNGTVMVSIPLTASLEQADRFVLQNAQWIRDTRVKNITKLNKDNADLPDKATVLAYFTAMSDKVYPAFAGVQAAGACAARLSGRSPLPCSCITSLLRRRSMW